MPRCAGASLQRQRADPPTLRAMEAGLPPFYLLHRAQFQGLPMRPRCVDASCRSAAESLQGWTSEVAPLLKGGCDPTATYLSPMLPGGPWGAPARSGACFPPKRAGPGAPPPQDPSAPSSASCSRSSQRQGCPDDARPCACRGQATLSAEAFQLPQTLPAQRALGPNSWQTPMSLQSPLHWKLNFLPTLFSPKALLPPATLGFAAALPGWTQQ
mmetsp:Transcript_32998/g.73433  ORF Transcript_32998/g.73433 Transcript_32998/m.73433 type:complete len:213 (+) Transcript_32998:98-736(+)